MLIVSLIRINFSARKASVALVIFDARKKKKKERNDAGSKRASDVIELGHSRACRLVPGSLFRQQAHPFPVVYYSSLPLIWTTCFEWRRYERRRWSLLRKGPSSVALQRSAGWTSTCKTFSDLRRPPPLPLALRTNHPGGHQPFYVRQQSHCDRIRDLHTRAHLRRSYACVHWTDCIARRINRAVRVIHVPLCVRGERRSLCSPGVERGCVSATLVYKIVGSAFEYCLSSQLTIIDLFLLIMIAPPCVLFLASRRYTLKS